MDSQESLFELPRNIERYLATLSQLYANEGKKLLQGIVVNSRIHVEEGWEYDNWDGGIDGHALYLTAPATLFDASLDQIDHLRQQIKEDLNRISHVRREYIAEVFLELDFAADGDWRKGTGLLVAPDRFIPERVMDRIWGGTGFRLFLSHKAEVRREVAKLKESLELYGVSAFVAHEDICPTREWQDEIEYALSSMEGFAALLTEDFHDSDWTDQEVGYAVARGVPIVPVRLARDPYGFIGRIQALSTTWETAAEGIVRLLMRYDTMLDAYIGALSQCSSYQNANVLAKALQGIENLTAPQIDRLVQVYNHNAELQGSFGFNGTRPDLFGPGLVTYLNRFGTRQFTYTSSQLIEPVA